MSMRGLVRRNVCEAIQTVIEQQHVKEGVIFKVEEYNSPPTTRNRIRMVDARSTPPRKRLLIFVKKITASPYSH